MAIEPSTCAPIVANDQPISRRINRVTVSAENVENVVRPPRKPVIEASRSAGGIDAFNAVYSIARPISRPPIRFALKVPSGRVGKTGLSQMPSRQRNNAPSAAPTEMPNQLEKYIIAS